MSVSPGARLGAYDVVASLGAGGMGEVYRARDTKLGRDVAIKVLPAALAHDPERAARFQREAQLLAALNHPHIATIHGFEDAGGAQFLVMELVEGETLAERLKAGALPVREALAIARQIADALQAAHEKGIIHRDLKPANVALTGDSQVKVLDFGLAKAMDDAGRSAGADLVTASPTLSLAATQAGMILGTAAYMAPEQARGKVADKRADVWAFGCVLYEMLTGKRAFEGEDAAQTLAFVMAREPDWSALPRDLPPAIATLLQRCLQKERRDRVGDIAAATFALEHAAQFSGAPAAAAAPSSVAQARPGVWQRAAPAAAALVVGAVIAGALVWLVMRPAAPSIVRTTMPTSGENALLQSGNDRDIAITPDGGTRGLPRRQPARRARARSIRAVAARRHRSATRPVHLTRRTVDRVL